VAQADHDHGEREGVTAMILDKKDPATTDYIRRFIVISGMIKAPIRMYVTSSDWQAVIDELDAQYADTLVDPTKPKPWGNNRPLQFGTKNNILTVVNSGTEDQTVCNQLNEDAARVASFGESKRRVLEQG
jgi:hypothetical protein